MSMNMKEDSSAPKYPGQGIVVSDFVILVHPLLRPPLLVALLDELVAVHDKGDE